MVTDGMPFASLRKDRCSSRHGEIRSAAVWINLLSKQLVDCRQFNVSLIGMLHAVNTTSDASWRCCSSLQNVLTIYELSCLLFTESSWKLNTDTVLTSIPCLSFNTGGASAPAVLCARRRGGVVLEDVCAEPGCGDGAGAPRGVPAPGGVQGAGRSALHKLPGGSHRSSHICSIQPHRKVRLGLDKQKCCMSTNHYQSCHAWLWVEENWGLTVIHNRYWLVKY